MQVNTVNETDRAPSSHAPYEQNCRNKIEFRKAITFWLYIYNYMECLQKLYIYAFAMVWGTKGNWIICTCHNAKQNQIKSSLRHIVHNKNDYSLANHKAEPLKFCIRLAFVHPPTPHSKKRTTPLKETHLFRFRMHDTLCFSEFNEQHSSVRRTKHSRIPQWRFCTLALCVCFYPIVPTAKFNAACFCVYENTSFAYPGFNASFRP